MWVMIMGAGPLTQRPGTTEMIGNALLSPGIPGITATNRLAAGMTLPGQVAYD
jgi:hypothetical protein